MMGKHFSFAKQCVHRFKPVIEQMTGTKLEDIVVKHSSEYPRFKPCSDYFRRNLMFTPTDYPNTIFVTEKNFDKKKRLYALIPKFTSHELSHLVHDELIKEELQAIESESKKARLLNRYEKGESFREGFAEYMSLNHLRAIYEQQTLFELITEVNRLSSYGDFSSEFRPYERGYKFFRKVLSVIGRDKVFEVARSPPISEIEVRMPLLYLLRRYPGKGIRNAPKFFVKRIKTKIIKKVHGRAPFDF